MPALGGKGGVLHGLVFRRAGEQEAYVFLCGLHGVERVAGRAIRRRGDRAPSADKEHERQGHPDGSGPHKQRERGGTPMRTVRPLLHDFGESGAPLLRGGTNAGRRLPGERRHPQERLQVAGQLRVLPQAVLYAYPASDSL
ncbi:MAG: hypothetical protein EXR67_04265 [Dehalococcoidia bacterium]|nr:hypothetical protein [Dehalococcoidia bacterium]